MKLRSVEKIKSRIVTWKPGFTRWYKRRTAKLHRKMAKEDPDNAPKRLNIRGWLD